MTNSKPQATKLVEIIPLQAIKTISLDFRGQVHTVRECPVDLFDAFVSQYTEVEDVNREVWSPFQRWRILNFLLEDHALEVEGDLLVEVEEAEVASGENIIMQEKPKTAIEQIGRTVELLRSNPQATDDDIRSLLDLRALGIARMYKVKARDIIENGVQEEGA